MSFNSQKAYKEIKSKLTAAINSGMLSHAYIIEGDGLSGKETFAQDFAKAILCEDAPGVGCDRCKICRQIDAGTYRDLYWVKSDDKSVKQGQIEELQDRISKNPVESGGRNIAIITDSDIMTSRAQNRILKDLEEPYPGTVIILLCENSSNLLQTIRSRCQLIRLMTIDTVELSPEMESQRTAAKEISKMIAAGEYFYKKNNEIKKIKDKKSAMLFLDALENEFRTAMIDNSTGGRDARKEIDSIKLIEKAREDIRYNVKERYALCDLILKLEDC